LTNEIFSFETQKRIAAADDNELAADEPYLCNEFIIAAEILYSCKACYELHIRSGSQGFHRIMTIKPLAGLGINDRNRELDILLIFSCDDLIYFLLQVRAESKLADKSGNDKKRNIFSNF
jgi:hypothetical protein